MSRSCYSSYLFHVALFNFFVCHGLSSLFVTLLLFTCHCPPSLLHATLLLVLDMSRPSLSLSCHAHALRHVTDLALFMFRYRVCVRRHAITNKIKTHSVVLRSHEHTIFNVLQIHITPVINIKWMAPKKWEIKLTRLLGQQNALSNISIDVMLSIQS